MWADRTLSAVESRQLSAAAVIEHHPSKVWRTLAMPFWLTLSVNIFWHRSD